MKKYTKILLCLMILITLTGCTKTIKKSYSSPSGEKISIKFKNKYKLDMTDSDPIEFKNGDDVIATLSIITSYGYEYYYNSLATDTMVDNKKEGNKKGNDYVCYRYARTEHKCLMKIKDSSSAILLSSTKTKDQLEEIFNSLNITKE